MRRLLTLWQKKSDVSIKYAPRKKNEARGRRKVKGNEWMDGGDGGEGGFNKARPLPYGS